MKASAPRLLQPGVWHLPFFDVDVGEAIAARAHAINNGSKLESLDPGVAGEVLNIAVRVSVARCARVSYESFETGRRSTVDEDLRLYDRLVGAQPLHASPAEHQATPDNIDNLHIENVQVVDKETRELKLKVMGHYTNPQEHGNFIGWRQYRKMLSGESCAPLPKEFQP